MAVQVNSSNLEALHVIDVGKDGARCLTNYRSEITVPWTYGIPDPAPAVGEVWLAEGLAKNTWRFVSKLEGSAFQVLRYMMRLDARTCVGRERSVTEDVVSSGVDGVLLAVASDSVLMWDSSLGDELKDGKWVSAGYGLRKYGDHVTQLVDRLVDAGVWVYLGISWELWTDTDDARQRRFQQVDAQGNYSPMISPRGASQALATMVRELKDLLGDKVRGVVLDGVRYAGEGYGFSPEDRTAFLAENKRDIPASVSDIPSPGYNGKAWWEERSLFDENREAGLTSMLAAIKARCPSMPVSAIVAPDAMCPVGSNSRVGELATGIGDSFGYGWSMVGMPLDFSRAPDEGSEMRSLEVSAAILRRLAGSSTPLFEVDLSRVSGFEAAFKVLNKYSASMCVVGRYEDWRLLPDSRQCELRDAMGSCRVSSVPTTPYIAVAVSNSSRDVSASALSENAQWTDRLYSFGATLLDKLPHRLKVLFDSDLPSVSIKDGYSALALWECENMADDAVSATEALVGSSVPVAVIGRCGRYRGRTEEERPELPFVRRFENADSGNEAEYAFEATTGQVDVEETSYALGDSAFDRGAVLAFEGGESGYVETLDPSTGTIERKASPFPLLFRGRSVWLGADTDEDDSLVELAGELAARAASR